MASKKASRAVDFIDDESIRLVFKSQNQAKLRGIKLGDEMVDEREVLLYLRVGWYVYQGAWRADVAYYNVVESDGGDCGIGVKDRDQCFTVKTSIPTVLPVARKRFASLSSLIATRFRDRNNI